MEKSEDIAKVTRIHPLGTMNVCRMNDVPDVSVGVKMLSRHHDAMQPD